MTTPATNTETVYLLAGANLGPFATVWPYAIHGDVQVWLDVGAGPVLLTEGPDYTLTDAIPSLSNGGNVLLSNTLIPGGGPNWPANLLPGAPADVNTPTVILERVTLDGQPSAFGEMASFSPQASEQALDYLARQIQEIDQRFDRAVVGLPGDDGWNPPDEITRASHLVGFDQYGAWTLYPLNGGGGGSGSVVGAPFPLSFALAGDAVPAANAAFPDWVLPYNISLPGNFAGVKWMAARIAPSAPYTVTFADQNGNAKGSLTLNLDGSVTGATPGGLAVVFNRGDSVRPTCPAIPDATAEDITMTLLATITG